MKMYYKQIAIGIIVLSVVSYYEYKIRTSYENGYKTASIKYESKIKTLREKKDKESKEKLDALRESSESWKQKAAENQQQTIKTETIYETIEKTIYECDDLGGEFLRIFNENRSRNFGRARD